jgi:3-dehydroquinate synthase
MPKSRKPLALSVTVPAQDLSHPVLVGAGVLARLGTEMKRSLPEARRVALVSDENVMALHGDAAQASLEAAEFAVVRVVTPAGERAKQPDELVSLVGTLVGSGLGRRDALVALGGGTVSDLAGLAAALFMRGIALFNVPTTLLAQVDAAIGGKVAVDLPSGKNLLGTFHFPIAVLVDPELLVTLPDVEVRCGIAEMLKHGALFSADHFDQVAEGAASIRAHEPEITSRLVGTSLALKASCIARDPLEQEAGNSGRALLNLGHTLAHAIERASSYEVRHGEAVALGLRAAARVSERKHVASESGLEERMTAALAAAELPTDLDAWLVAARGDDVARALSNDKKRGFGSIAYIALARIGEPARLSLTPAEIMGLLRGEAAPC